MAELSHFVSWLRKGEEAEKKSATALIYVRNQGDGQRLVNAIKRAAVLCGAPAGWRSGRAILKRRSLTNEWGRRANRLVP